MGPKTCIDRIATAEQLVRAAELSIAENAANVPVVVVHPGMGVAPPTPFELAGVTGKKWQNGKRLRVRFLDGSPSVQQRVEDHAKRWCDFANVTIEFGNDADAEIRISFAQEGSWSYIGTTALAIDGAEPTMNFGWLEENTPDEEYERVVVHEFGHALFCIHEHQNPSTNIPWDKDAVYAYYMGPPNNWTKEQVDQNLFARYSQDITQFSTFDPKSIMLYPIPNEFTIGDFEVGFNTTLSDTDKSFIATIYPKGDPDVLELEVGGAPVEASIGAHGEEDRFRFDVGAGGKHVVATDGPTDVTMALLGPDDPTLLVGQDDDSGKGSNAKIEAALEPGSYEVRVRHFRPTGTGPYSLSVQRIAA
jgi:Bacterial pre-peptidase C-terminal domain